MTKERRAHPRRRKTDKKLDEAYAKTRRTVSLLNYIKKLEMMIDEL